MLPFTRRWFLLGTVGLVFTGRGFAQTGHDHHGGLYERLQTPGRIGLPDIAPTTTSTTRRATSGALPFAI